MAFHGNLSKKVKNRVFELWERAKHERGEFKRLMMKDELVRKTWKRWSAAKQWCADNDLFIGAPISTKFKWKRLTDADWAKVDEALKSSEEMPATLKTLSEIVRQPVNEGQARFIAHQRGVSINKGAPSPTPKAEQPEPSKVTTEERTAFDALVKATFKAEGEARRLRVRVGGEDDSVSAAKILGKNKTETAGLLREFVAQGLLLDIAEGDTAWYYLNEKRGNEWPYDPEELIKVLPSAEINRIETAIVIHEPRTFTAIAKQLYGDRKGENHVLRAVLKHLTGTKAVMHNRQADTYQRSPKEFLKLAETWNDVKNYPANYDLERALGKKIDGIQRDVRAYCAFRLQYPDIGLPALYLRRLKSGSLIAIPPGVLEQLEPFRFDADKLNNVKAFVVTGAQFGANLNTSFWASLMQYERQRGAPVCALTIKYGPVKTVYQKEIGDRVLTSTFPDELAGRVILEDILVCGGRLMLNTMRMRPTLEKFLTSRICEQGGIVSQIFAAPKLELDHRPRLGHQFPKAIMTTGACTYANYSVDNLGQQDRTGEIAMEEHTFAAIVVEYDGALFHFRQLLANKKGEFFDINPQKGGADYFMPRGVEHHPDGVDTIVTGDWHTQKTAKEVRTGTFEKGGMVDVLKPKRVIIHDLVDGDSVNPYQVREASRRTYMAQKGWDSLENELDSAKAELDWMRKLYPDLELYVAASNHPEFITWYVEERKYNDDDTNREIGSRLHLMMVDDLKRRNPEKVDARATDPVILWLRERCPTIQFLERQDELLLPPGVKDQILVSMHGDVGMRGGETRSTEAFRQMNVRVTLGHNHTSTINGPIWRVGTSTPRMQFYIRNPVTNWTNTHQVIFKNSQRQNVNFVKGEWYGRRQWATMGDNKSDEKK